MAFWPRKFRASEAITAPEGSVPQTVPYLFQFIEVDSILLAYPPGSSS